MDVNVTFPETYQSKELEGKDALFKVSIQEVKEKKYPELDDEFASDVSEFETLEEYKVDVKKKLEERKAAAAKQAKENSLLRHANYDPIRHMGHINEVYGSPMGSSYECTTLTYQPMSLAGTLQEIPKINYKSRWYSNGVALQFMYVTVMHRPTDNGLSFNFEYQKNEVTEDEIEKLYYYLMRAIFLGVEDPNRTIGEILEWM